MANGAARSCLMPSRLARRVGVAAGAVGVAHDILLGELLGRRLVPVRLLILRQLLRILVGEFLLPVGRALLRRARGDGRALARIIVPTRNVGIVAVFMVLPLLGHGLPSRCLYMDVVRLTLWAHAVARRSSGRVPHPSGGRSS